jgi:hypothetical protein
LRQFRWTATIAPAQWAIYKSAIEALRDARIDFLLGGGFALATFTGRWRDTKDIDLYVKPTDRDAAVAVLTGAGFEDYYKHLPYDRKWIYRNVRDGVIVDIIWSMANQRAQVDELWFERADSVRIRDQVLRVTPQEELLWCKLYIVQHDHCDWIDIFNLLYATGASLDWKHLLRRLENDTPLLRALLSVYGWLCPGSALKLPRWLWKHLRIPPPQPRSSSRKPNPIRLLDSRAWFSALVPKGKKLEI